MIASQSINVNSCVVCFVYQGPNETTTYYNDNMGHFHKYIYVLEGQIDTYPTLDGTITPDIENAPLNTDTLYDITPTKGKYVVGKTGNVGAAMVMFNPIPLDNNLNVEVFKGNQTINIIETNERKVIMCMSGAVQINGKTVSSNQFATVHIGKSATLVMNDTDICAIITG